MSCVGCILEIGSNYSVQGDCANCGTHIRNATGEYMGKYGNMHRFRLHPRFVCPGCNTLRAYSVFPCEDMIDVTEEFSENIWKLLGEEK